MKIGLVQYNPLIGDFAHNCKKIVSWATKAQEAGCSLVVFPELAVSGYPPLDLLERSVFIEEHQAALDRLLGELPGIDVMFGAVEKREGKGGRALYNSVLVAREGRVVYRRRKQLLPTYDVFDESRYFEPGRAEESEKFYTLGGTTFGVTICEDVWHDEVGHYALSPVSGMVESCREKNISLAAVINISASPFQRGKEAQRRRIFAESALALGAPFLYCNQVGGQDSLIFDGGSLAISERGEVLGEAASCAEDLLVYDTESQECSAPPRPLASPEESVYQALVLGVRDYIRKCGFTSVVLGLSGGIDSALTAAIAVDALGAENVQGVALPSQYSSGGSYDDAQSLAENLGCDFKMIPIKDLFYAFESSLAPIFTGLEEDVTEQNLQARIRGNLLMALSNKFNKLLLTTGNKSEMAVGYCTLYGDMNGGLAVISDVPKQLVYALSRYVNRHGEIIPENTISKPPSAELKPDQCDQDDLPDYDVLDRVLELHLEDGCGCEEIVAHGFDRQMVQDVLRRVRLNEYKRKQAAVGLKVTSKAFGYGRRFPNAQNFRN
ncbi:NAD+ synthase [Desulfotalea psychrophila]|uniref:Glutamine-dependent NAD(+) synthetase n=1 Tax=Desulfotalea psychrophila (strain LSv54 / DSM 12343) TaxID=177439 RepID=Q6AJ32_DESPS|nr:NAD+ synthase [Desulfotalea psychrophila]CAG37648.1 probable glutamine-dependent NAD(+) synthetase [Desulfotalea psychrophila LSv54]